MSLIYVVEDDPAIREVETIALKNSNYTVEAFECASDFYVRLEETMPDLIILDIMLPDEDGYTIIRKLRRQMKTRWIPVIMVTAKATEMDMVKGLDDGADDYIRKPFSLLELISRVKVQLRRTQTEEVRMLTVGHIEMDHERHAVFSDGTLLDLTFKEYELLRYLMINAEVVLSRDSIMETVWGTDYAGETRTVDMHIKTLRQKLGDSGKQIKTVRNVGYVIKKHRGEENEAEN